MFLKLEVAEERQTMVNNMGIELGAAQCRPLHKSAMGLIVPLKNDKNEVNQIGQCTADHRLVLSQQATNTRHHRE